MRIAAINWNHTHLYKRLTAWSTVGLVLTSLLFQIAPVQAAGSATLTLVPATADYKKGDSFALTIHENSGSNTANAVEANLSYDTSKLQFAGLNGTSGVFTLTAPSLQSGGNGAVSYSGAAAPSVTGDQIVAVVTFTALADSGSTKITFSSDSQVIDPSNNNQSIWDGNPVGATINLSAVASGGSTGGTTSGTSSKPKSTTGTKTTTPTTAPTTTTTPSPTTTPPATAIPKTYFVAIKVTDDNGKIVKDALVTLDDKSTHTDATGEATFSGISSGEHSVTAEVNGKKVSQSITVASSDASLDVQQFDIKVAASKTTNLVWIFVLLLALVVISGGGWTVGQSLTHRHRMAAAMSHNSTGMPAESITTSTSDSKAKPNSTPSESTPGSQVFYPDPKHPLVDPPSDDNSNDGTT